MNDLPRREPTPLDPPAGAFERTLRRARRRRQQTTALAAAALVAVCVGGVSGAMLLRGSPSGRPVADPGSISQSYPADGHRSPDGPSGSASGGAGRGSSSGAPVRPSSAPPGSGSAQSSPPASGRGGQPSSSGGPTNTGPLYHGRAVDSDGRALRGINVYRQEQGRLVKVTTTGPDGSFQAPCSSDRLLLASSDFTTGSPGSGQNYAYTYANNPDARCAPATANTPRVATTVMAIGGQLAITVTDAGGQPLAGSTQPQLFCPTSAEQPCLTMTTDGEGRHTFTGLATGTYTLRGAASSQSYHVTAGQTTTVTWIEPAPSAPPSDSAPPTSSPPDNPPSTAPSSSDEPSAPAS